MQHPQNSACGVVCALSCLMMHLVCWSFLGTLQLPVTSLLLLFISAEKWRIYYTAALQAGAGDHRATQFLYRSSNSREHLEPFHTNSVQCGKLNCGNAVEFQWESKPHIFALKASMTIYRKQDRAKGNSKRRILYEIQWLLSNSQM